MTKSGHVEAVCAASLHGFAKEPRKAIMLIEGYGIAGDVHAGGKVKHLYTARKHPGRPNLRQVHVVARGLYDRLREDGYALHYGDLGENVVLSGFDLLALPKGAVLEFARGGRLTITGLREPCAKIDRFMKGLRQAVTIKLADQRVVKNALMTAVSASGEVRPGDEVTLRLPLGPPLPLDLA